MRQYSASNSASAIACVTVRFAKPFRASMPSAARLLMFLSLWPSSARRSFGVSTFMTRCHFTGATSSYGMSTAVSAISSLPKPFPNVNDEATPMSGEDQTCSSIA